MRLIIIQKSLQRIVSVIRENKFQIQSIVNFLQCNLSWGEALMPGLRVVHCRMASCSKSQLAGTQFLKANCRRSVQNEENQTPAGEITIPHLVQETRASQSEGNKLWIFRLFQSLLLLKRRCFIEINDILLFNWKIHLNLIQQN